MGEARIREWSCGRMPQLKYWINEPAGVVTGILVGNNLINIAFSAIFTLIVASLAQQRQLSGAWPEILSITGSSIIILTFGEIIPKTFANTYPDRVVKAYYRIFLKFYRPLRSFSGFLNRISFALVGNLKSRKEKYISRREIQMEIESAGKEGHLEMDFSQMLGGAILLSQKRVGEVMTPREKITAINLERGYKQIINILLKSKYSRVPAYTGRLDKVKGFIYIKDVIGQLNREGKADFKKILRKPKVTRQKKSCQRLFQEMRKERMHACVVKSKNRVVGIVTIEDLIEEVVGEIYDEYDRGVELSL